MKRRSNKTDSDAADKKSIKRPREEEQFKTPQYGSKEYWEARYKSHLPDVHVQKVSGKSDEVVGTTGDSKIDDADAKYELDGIELSKEAINPGHAWYFTYEELRPLILPLILGSAESGAEELESECDDGDSWVEEEAEDGIEQEDEEDVEEEEEEGGPNDAEDEEHVESSEMVVADETIVQDKPKKVLEIGCGDVPLGVELAADLAKMQEGTGVAAELVVSEISCIDYSDIVVKSLIDKQKKEHSSTLQVSFDSLDARDLPYSPNTYDLVLEKGTLDAMLSDEGEGKQNCIQIVKEMARVTNIGGSILIVSHLNANEPKGMGWLEDIVFRGLEAEFSEQREATKKAKEDYAWSVEVHGGEGEINDKDEMISFGPAVYIIRKKSVPPVAIARELSSKKEDLENKESDDGDETEMAMPPVKVQFLTYD